MGVLYGVSGEEYVSKIIQMASRIHFHDVLGQRFQFSCLLLSLGYSHLLEDIQILVICASSPHAPHLQASHSLSNSHALILSHFPFPLTRENSLLMGSPIASDPLRSFYHNFGEFDTSISLQNPFIMVPRLIFE